MAEFNLTPVFRMEKFIDAILKGTTPPEPKFREEFYFAKVAGMDVELPTPITSREFYLAKYAGMDVDLPVPVTRDEMYLALACGLGVEPPEPVFRDEYWLYELSGGGGWSWKTVTGTLIHITDALASPMQKCEVTLEPVQDLHGQDAPYPAGGGKNMAYLEQGSLNLATGAEISSTTRVRTNFIPVEYASPVGIYYVASSQNNGWSVRNGIGYDENKSYVSNGVYPDSVNGRYTVLNPDIKYVRFIYSHANTSESCSPSDYWYQFEQGSTPTTYAPYENICPITGWTGANIYHSGEDTSDPTTYTISWQDDAGTVYGGTVDLVSGKVKLNKTSLVLTSDMEISAYNYQNKHGVGFEEVLPFKMARASGLCSHTGKVGSYFDENSMWLGANSNWIYWIGILDVLGLSTVEEFKDWLDTQTVQVVFTNDEQAEISLTPQEISTLAGENNVWGDGTIELTYKAQSS